MVEELVEFNNIEEEEEDEDDDSSLKMLGGEILLSIQLYFILFSTSPSSSMSDVITVRFLFVKNTFECGKKNRK